MATEAHAERRIEPELQVLRLQSWLRGPGDANVVIDRFAGDDWTVVVDDRADVHVSSADGAVYLGWFPAGRPGSGDGWVIAVTGTRGSTGYRIAFSRETPATVVAAAIERIRATAQPFAYSEEDL
ncbi:DUF317 domain-containing protein [Streptomyces sp. MS19]|uniref:DUF317 domain-containing protein n=1 Tax=Streptomyces sp. MS19 TaxID=3385972 RepID=UPI0039A3C481